MRTAKAIRKLANPHVLPSEDAPFMNAQMLGLSLARFLVEAEEALKAAGCMTPEMVQQ